MKSAHKVILLTVAGAGLYWLLDASVGLLFFHDEPFVTQLLFGATSHDFYLRITGVLSLLTFGGVTSVYAARQGRIREELRKSREDRRNLYNNAQAGLARTRLSDGKILECNDRMAQMLGYESRQQCLREGFIGRHYADADTRPRLLEELRQNGEVSGFEARGVRRDGSTIWMRYSARLPPGQEYVEGLAIDVTAEKRSRQALEKSKRQEQCFREQLAALHEVTLELSTTRSFDDLCRKAVELSRSKLGFERLGLWFCCDEPLVARGGFGTDESGAVRDERDQQGPVDPDSLMGQVLAGKLPLAVSEDEELRSVAGDAVGHGTLAIASLWDGEKVIGCVCADNLLTGRPMPANQCHVLRLYASTLGQLCSNKRAEEKLRESDEFSFTVLNNSPHPIVVIDADTSVRYANPALEKLTGFNLNEIVGRKAPYPWWTPETLARTAADLREAMRAGADRLEELFQKKSGERFRVEIAAVPVETEEGRLKYYMSSWTDITDRKRAEEEVRRRNEELRVQRDFAESLLETAQAIIVVLDTEGRIVRFNRFAQELTGYSQQELQGRDWFETFIPGAAASETRETFKRILREGGARDIVNPVLVKGGGEVLVRWYNSVLRDAAGRATAVLAIGHDITEIRQQQEQLRQAAKMEAIGRLAGGIAHDFNNMLAIIQGYADMLIGSVAEDPDIREDLEKIRTAAGRATQLTRRLLALGRRQVIRPRVVRLNEIITDMDAMLRRTLGEDIELETAPGEGLWHVKADPTQMEEVILNLVLNARDAMPDGGRLTIRTENVTLDEKYARIHPGVVPGEYVLLAVSDTGVGMSTEVADHIFEPFFTTKEGTGGTGLGLPVCYGIVTQIAGHIAADSRPGHGATFRIHLPRTTELPEDRPRTAAAAEGPGALPEGSGTILLAEDEQAVRQLVARVLRQCGYTVLEAGNAKEALPLGKHYEGKIDLLLADVVMPGTDGKKLADQLAPARPDMKVLFISGYDASAVAQHGVLENGLNFLYKPSSPGRIAEAVRRVLSAPAGAPTPEGGQAGGART